MRLWLRFLVPLAIALTLLAYAVVPLADRLTQRWFVRDLDLRSDLIVNTIREPLLELIETGRKARIRNYFEQITKDERLVALGYLDPEDGKLVATKAFPRHLRPLVISPPPGESSLVEAHHEGLHVTTKPLAGSGGVLGTLVLVHDLSFIQRRGADTRRYVFYFFLLVAATVSLVTVVIAQVSWRGWIRGTQALLRGEARLLGPPEGQRPTAAELQPIAKDLRALIRDLETECRQRDESQITWHPETLRTILKRELRGEEVLVVSNRQPYIHNRTAGGIEVQQPASGLVTALEPILRACSGTWIAHGSGSADRAVVDRQDRVAVPPEDPSYRIRRIWLTAEEEGGYYYGFANEGLWPLCHIAHVRPTFRAADWEQYVRVNRKFAEAVVDEAGSEDPIVLVQDYHFALLPRMIRKKLPRATVITFWHIPWPNPESFMICPWRAELLEGMLGSSILGFHTQFHCNNFVDTVDRVLEARVDRETFTISYGGMPTAVHRYPISIEWPPPLDFTEKPVDRCREDVRARHGLPAEHLIGFGVDRLDYTKGILERFLAVERLLEWKPEWVGRFSFLQIAAPSRSSIPQYREFQAEVRALAERVNRRFGREGYLPILLLVEHHGHRSVYEHFRAADFCFVSSLHDGMNLVAKEFVAARDDERGVLLLSQFTGASRELPEALVVNPYDNEQCAAAMHLALTMPPAEQRDRMRLMRGLIREFNVYRWAGRMLLDAATMRKRERLLRSPEGRTTA
ncbi:MAG: trehalose-6-phosphate synthase [Deltaproteobacteria bacterium]|nr:trehalose-6-phosphate synthase [Deltaproteobacteria bacterium]